MIEVLNITETDVILNWKFSSDQIETLLKIDGWEIAPTLLESGTTNYTLTNLTPGTFYNILVFPVFVGSGSNFVLKTPRESLSPLGDPLTVEVITLMFEPSVVVEQEDEHSISGTLVLQASSFMAEISLQKLFHNPIIISHNSDSFTEHLRWKFDNLLPGNEYFIQTKIFDANKVPAFSVIKKVFTLPKAPNPIHQHVDSTTMSTVVILDLQMLITAFELKIISQTFEEVVGPINYTPRFTFHADSNLFGCEMQTRSYNREMVGKWYRFSIGISVLGDLLLHYNRFDSIMFTWSLGSGKTTDLIFSYTYYSDSFQGNITSDEVNCNAEQLSCVLDYILIPETKPMFIITPYYSPKNISGLSLFYSFTVPSLEYNSSYSKSVFLNGISVITLGVCYYGKFDTFFVQYWTERNKKNSPRSVGG